MLSALISITDAEDIQTSALKITKSRLTIGTSVTELVVSPQSAQPGPINNSYGELDILLEAYNKCNALLKDPPETISFGLEKKPNTYVTSFGTSDQSSASVCGQETPKSQLSHLRTHRRLLSLERTQ